MSNKGGKDRSPSPAGDNNNTCRSAVPSVSTQYSMQATSLHITLTNTTKQQQGRAGLYTTVLQHLCYEKRFWSAHLPALLLLLTGVQPRLSINAISNRDDEDMYKVSDEAWTTVESVGFVPRGCVWHGHDRTQSSS